MLSYFIAVWNYYVFCLKELLYTGFRLALKTIYNIDIKYGIAYFRILKKIFLKNEKMANQKLGNLGNLGNIIPSFRFYPTAKIKSSDLKISEIFFRDFRDFRCFRVFDLAPPNSLFWQVSDITCHQKNNHEKRLKKHYNYVKKSLKKPALLLLFRVPVIVIVQCHW